LNALMVSGRPASETGCYTNAHEDRFDMRVLKLPRCVVDLHTGEVRRTDRPATRLTSQEAHLLARLARTPGRAVSRDELLAEVWGFRTAVVSRAPDIAIRRLRTKIEIDPSHPCVITTVRGEGWCLEGPVTDDREVHADRAEQLVTLARRHAPEMLTELLVAIDTAVGDQLASEDRQHLLDRALPTPQVLRRRALVTWDRGLPGARQELHRLRTLAIADGDDTLAGWLTVDLSGMNRADRAGDPDERVRLEALTDPVWADLSVSALLELATLDADAGDWDAARAGLSKAELKSRTAHQRIAWACSAGHVALCASRPSDGMAALESVVGDLGADRLAERAWRTLGGLRFFAGDLTGARDAWESALFLARRLGGWRQVASTVGNLGIVQAELGDLDAARSAFEEALGRSQELGQHQTTSSNQVNLGLVNLLDGDVSAARAALLSGRSGSDAQGRRPTARLAELGLAIADQLSGVPAADRLARLAEESEQAGDGRIGGLARSHQGIEQPEFWQRLDHAPYAGEDLGGVRRALNVWRRGQASAPADLTAHGRLWWSVVVRTR
jgi:DNA-binding winged helix-turn-helix (wHTH) protein